MHGMRFACFIFITAFIIFLDISAAHAFRVTPMIADLRPSGGDATTTVRIENTGPKDLPIEVIVERRVIKEDGSETRAPADDDFLVFPPQAVIPPGKTQALRIQYIGDPNIQNSRGYLVTVAQVPVSFEEEQSGIQFAFQFGVSINVVPEQAQPDVQIMSYTPAEGGISLLLKNEGTAYTRLSYGKWTFTAPSGQTHVLEGEALKEAIQQPLIQPQTTRNIILPVPAAFQTDEVQIVYEPSN